MDNGWIRLHRKILSDPIVQDHKLFCLWINLLLMANHKDKKIIWNKQEMVIPKGSLVTGRSKLVQKTQLSERNVRTGLTTLKTTNKVTIKAYSKFSLITIINWDRYQGVDQQNDQQVTSKRPASDQQVTTYNKDKNVNNEKNIHALFSKKNNSEDLQDQVDVKLFFKKVWNGWPKNRKMSVNYSEAYRMLEENVNLLDKADFGLFKGIMEGYAVCDEVQNEIVMNIDKFIKNWRNLV